jgi:hypothetical protein
MAPYSTGSSPELTTASANNDDGMENHRDELNTFGRVFLPPTTKTMERQGPGIKLAKRKQLQVSSEKFSEVKSKKLTCPIN